MRALVRTAILSLALSFLLAPTAQGAIPRLLAWQGVALDSLDQPLANGSYLFWFSIWNDDVGGDSLWGEEQVVSVENGVLNVLLGSLYPIPDSVFDTPGRWLQVRFENEAPYFPRTQIVSVGYAYRVGTLNGASGGTVSSDIRIASPFTNAGLRVFGEGGAPEVGYLGGNNRGGVLDLTDEDGNPIVELAPSFTGEGGSFLLFSDSGFTRGLQIWNPGPGDPDLYMVGAHAALEFNMGVSGNDAIQFSPNAISDPEILDEPGVVSPAEGGSLPGIAQSYVTLAYATATFPDAGYAVVITEATFNAQTENVWLDARLVVDSLQAGFWYWDAGDADGYYDQRQTHIYTQPVTQGSHTFELQVRQQMVGTCAASDRKIVVLYFPTAYGTLSSPSATEASDGAAAGLQLVSDSPPVDVAAEQAASIESDADRVRRELDEMRTRMERLEALLKSRQETAEWDRQR